MYLCLKLCFQNYTVYRYFYAKNNYLLVLSINLPEKNL